MSSYIGRQLNNLSDRVKLDSLTASATATYNLLLNGVAYVPSSAESLTVVLNGIQQAPQSSYTVSGSQITFASALTSSDSIDFILAERSITLQTPSAGSVGTSQLAADAVNGNKIADDSISDEHLDITAITGQTEKTSLADADKFLISDSAASGALKYVQKSNLPSGGLVQTGRSIISSSTAGIYLDDIFSTTYTNYIILIRNMTPVSDEDDFRFRVNVSGTQKSTAEYIYMTEFLDTGGGTQGHESSTSDTEIKLAHDVDNESWKGGYNAIMHVSTHLSDASNRAAFVMSGTASYIGDSGIGYVSHFGGSYADSDRAAVTGLDFYYNSGNIARGEITCYGLVIS